MALTGGQLLPVLLILVPVLGGALIAYAGRRRVLGGLRGLALAYLFGAVAALASGVLEVSVASLLASLAVIVGGIYRLIDMGNTTTNIMSDMVGTVILSDRAPTTGSSE